MIGWVRQEGSVTSRMTMSSAARGTAALAGIAAALGLAACGPAPSSGASGAGSTPPSASGAAPAPASAPAAPASAPAAAPVPSMVPLQTPGAGSFASPTRNITCDIETRTATPPATVKDGVSCITSVPFREVDMGADGTYTVCTDDTKCGWNSGEGTPTLAYGTATGAGPYRCISAASGMTCLADGKGFTISASGITAAAS